MTKRSDEVRSDEDHGVQRYLFFRQKNKRNIKIMNYALMHYELFCIFAHEQSPKMDI